MKYFALLSLFLIIACLLNAQTQQDTIYTNYSATPVLIDGSDADACWADAQWQYINQIWLPSTTSTMAEGDFEGKFKVAWDKDYLYILVEIVDDVLSDDFASPLDNYWNDDCVEIFIDEDRSKGNHERSYNAFAYHVSTFYDVIDGGNGTTVNLKSNLNVVMDTIAENTYRWEFAVKIFNKNFNSNNPEVSREKLTPNKLMGFSIAYCDNDDAANKQRENFIGSIIMTEATKNVNYQIADYFGSMLLVDKDNQWVSSTRILKESIQFSLFPSVVKDQLTIECIQPSNGNYIVEVIDSRGRVVREFSFSGQQKTIGLNELTNGVYVVRCTNEQYTQSLKFLKL